MNERPVGPDGALPVKRQEMQESRLRMQRLFYYRMVIAGFLLLIAAYLYFQPFPSAQRHILLAIAIVYFLFIPLQRMLIRRISSLDVGLALQFAGDLLLVAGLVFATGGVASPFAFLFGLIIVAVGMQATPLLAIAIAILASVAYLCAVYSYVWYSESVLQMGATLLILLQTSALFLVGGVMAALARRHAQLQQESRQAISRHRSLQELHGQMMETMHEGMLVFDKYLIVQDSNQAAREIFSQGAVLQGRSLSDLMSVPEELVECFMKPGASGCRSEWQEGERTFLVNLVRLPEGGEASTWLMSVVDISEARALEKRLADQDKLTSLGRMAAMLAHEIRNPLQTFSQALELMPGSKSSREREMRAIMTEEVGRLNRLISSMLNYTRPLRPAPKNVDMEPLLDGTLRQADIRGIHRIQWRSDFHSLCLDADHFHLILDNLIRNAVAASPKPESVQVHLYEEEGKWCLAVSDEGGGIPDEVREHLFEPFVTSRSAGFGLGLATVWQVCQANGWEIRCEATGQGSRFLICGGQVGKSMQVPMEETG